MTRDHGTFQSEPEFADEMDTISNSNEMVALLFTKVSLAAFTAFGAILMIATCLHGVA